LFKSEISEEDKGKLREEGAVTKEMKKLKEKEKKR